MARKPESPEILTAEERKSFIRRFRQAADMLEDLDDLVSGDVWLFRKPSLVDGFRRIDAFTVDLRRTMNQIIAGKPLTKKSTKADLIG